MLFRYLQTSPALSLERYVDIDHFRESERYVKAESLPLASGDFSVLRATLSFASCTLSLVRTFPRLIKGYDMSGRLVIVVPMNDISSARVNGREIGQSLLVLKGEANCTVYEPESRLVAILSIRSEMLDYTWQSFRNGHFLVRLPAPRLAQLQMLINEMLRFAARKPEAVRPNGVLETMRQALFAAFDEAMCFGELHDGDRRGSSNRYKMIVDRIDRLISFNPATDLKCDQLADKIGISVRTLQTATRQVCGSGTHQYGRLLRLWSVRRQLRTGAPGLTVKASALAHGFWHMGEFSSVYRQAFGESPSHTLSRHRSSEFMPPMS
jgi:AraC family ethanolamine operon transcriptional activator